VITKEAVEAISSAVKKLECSKCKVRQSWLKSKAVETLKQELKKERQKNRNLKKQISELEEQNRKLKAINTRILSALRNHNFLVRERHIKDLIYLAEQAGFKIFLHGKRGKFDYFEVHMEGVER